MKSFLLLLFLSASMFSSACRDCSSVMTQGRKTTWSGPQNITQTNGTFATATGRISVRFAKWGEGQATGVTLSGITAQGEPFSQTFGYGSFVVPPGTYTVYVQGHLYGVGTLEGHVCYE